MRREPFSCFGNRCVSDSSDDEEGYTRLENQTSADMDYASADGGADEGHHGEEERAEDEYFRPTNAYQGRTRRERTAADGGDNCDDEGEKGPTSYSGINVKGREGKKAKRKTIRRRVRHILHSTWKWFKRGMVSVAPSVTSMLMIIPSPSSAFVTDASRREAAKQRETTRVFL